MDAIQFITEVAHAIAKNGWSLTTLIIAVTALLRVNAVRRVILRRLPKRFRYEDKLERVERKIDAISAHLGVEPWFADTLKVTTPRLTKTRSVGTMFSWAAGCRVRCAARRVNLLNTKSNTRRKKFMQKFKSRKFILAVVSAVLIVLNDGLDLGINTETVLAFAGLVAVWITGESVVDAKRAGKENSNAVTYTDPGPAE